MLSADQKLQYENQGFLYLPQCVPALMVDRIARAFNNAAAEYLANWERLSSEGKIAPFYDLPDILDVDDAFVELAILPELLPVLLTTIGEDVQLQQTTARIFPPGKTFTAYWHSDMQETLGVDLAHSPNFLIKLHFYFEDLAPEQGCLAFLPGTHRLPRGYPRPKIDDPEHSPAVVKIVPKKGDAVLFNTHLLHMCQDNKSPDVRKSVIYTYSHFWMKAYPNASPKNLDKYRLGPLQRQIFGIGQPGISIFDQRGHDPSGVPLIDNAIDNGQRLIQKAGQLLTNWAEVRKVGR